MNEQASTAAKSKTVLPYRRRFRNILIHKPMQREFTLVMIALLMVSSLAIGFVIHNTIREAAFGGGFQFGRINPYEILSDVSYQLILRVTCILFVTLIVLGAFGIFFLHRVAGPVYRFRQVLIRINDSQIPHPIKLREGDFFTEVAIEINRLLEKLQFDKEKLQLVREKAEKMITDRSPESMARSAEELKAIIDKGQCR
ncbi:MAG: hypothetical protein NC930_03880 [Candidatus Omnitrophica bacterium]|nr:hypothetical protein [Candidatus Omnitrophota bacterium]